MQGVSFGNMQLLNLCFFMICFVFKKQQDNRVLEEIDRRLLIVVYTPCGIKDTKTVVLIIVVFPYCLLPFRLLPFRGTI